MTRETKLGLVVSGSFLCLVGIVLFSKLNEQGSSSAGDGQEGEVQADVDPIPVAEKSADQKPNSVRAIAIPGSTDTTSGQVTKMGSGLSNVFKGPEGASSIQPASAKSAANQAKPPDASAIGAGLPAFKNNEALEQVIGEQPLIVDSEKDKVSSGKESGPTQPESARGNKTSSSIPGFPGFQTKSFETSAGKQEGIKDNPAKSPVPPAAVSSSSTNSSSTGPAKDNSQSGMAGTVRPSDKMQNATGQANSADGRQSAGNSMRNTGSVLPLPPPPPAAEDLDLKAGPAPAGKDGTKETKLESSPLTGVQGTGTGSGLGTESSSSATSEVPSLRKTNPTTPITSMAPGIAKVKQITVRPEAGNGADGVKNGAPPGPPAMQAASPGTTSGDRAPLLGGQSAGRDGGQVAAASNGSVSAAGTGVDKNSQQGVRAQALPGASGSPSSPDRALPVLGAPVPSLNSSITVPAPKGAATSAATNDARVESYDEDRHVCGAKDTFRTISQTYYQSDRFAEALVLFNRNHPLAADGMRQDPPRLQVGQAVYVPPAKILEKYYATAITDATPGQPGVAPAPMSQDPAGAIRPSPGAPPATVTPKPAVATVSEKTYRVGSNAEMMREIARRALGDGDRWTEIYQLNLRYDPKEPVPAGTELRLPNDPRVESLNTP